MVSHQHQETYSYLQWFNNWPALRPSTKRFHQPWHDEVSWDRTWRNFKNHLGRENSSEHELKAVTSRILATTPPTYCTDIFKGLPSSILWGPIIQLFPFGFGLPATEDDLAPLPKEFYASSGCHFEMETVQKRQLVASKQLSVSLEKRGYNYNIPRKQLNVSSLTLFRTSSRNWP